MRFAPAAMFFSILLLSGKHLPQKNLNSRPSKLLAILEAYSHHFPGTQFFTQNRLDTTASIMSMHIPCFIIPPCIYLLQAVFFLFSKKLRISGENMDRTDRKSRVPPIGRVMKGQKDP